MKRCVQAGMNRWLGLVGAVSLLALAACAGHEHRLRPGPDGRQITGRMLHGGAGGTSHLFVELEGKRFAGSFRVQRTQDWQALRERYRTDPRRWERINAGLDKTHELSAARAELQAPDGDGIICDLLWPSRATPAGICRDQRGELLPVRFE